jgi:ferredoxin
MQIKLQKYASYYGMHMKTELAEVCKKQVYIPIFNMDTSFQKCILCNVCNKICKICKIYKSPFHIPNTNKMSNTGTMACLKEAE